MAMTMFLLPNSIRGSAIIGIIQEALTNIRVINKASDDFVPPF
jgi:hypothetical protein